MNKILRETTHLCVEIMNSKRQVNAKPDHVVQSGVFRSTLRWSLTTLLSSNGVTLESSTIPPPTPTCIQSCGVDCFRQVARTVAQHCMQGVGEGKLNFPLLIWQIVRKVVWGKVSQLILSPIYHHRGPFWTAVKNFTLTCLLCLFLVPLGWAWGRWHPWRGCYSKRRGVRQRKRYLWLSHKVMSCVIQSTLNVLLIFFDMLYGGIIKLCSYK